MSIVLGSKSFWPHVAYAMDGEQNMLASIMGFTFHFKVPVCKVHALKLELSIMQVMIFC